MLAAEARALRVAEDRGVPAGCLGARVDNS